MQFDRYAFDLSQFAGGSQVTYYSVRERYLWELFRPDPNDALFKLVPGQFRSELHDRILGPIYPFAFLVLAYTFLGAPSTTRQSRIWSIVTLTAAVVSLRLMGFVSSIVGQAVPAPDRVPVSSPRGDDRTLPVCHLARDDHRAAGQPGQPRQHADRILQAPRRGDDGGGAMSMTLARYFGARFLVTFAAIFAGVFGLVMLVDYLEMMRRHADMPHASALLIAKASLYRVPQIVERILPFCCPDRGDVVVPHACRGGSSS